MKIVRSFEQIINHRKDFPRTFFRADETITINLNELADDLLSKESCLDANTAFISLVVNLERIGSDIETYETEMVEYRKQRDDCFRKIDEWGAAVDKEWNKMKLRKSIARSEKELEALNC